MATVDTNAQNEQSDLIKANWLNRLSDLIAIIEKWAIESDWSTRWIEKRMEDSELGDYLAPAMLLQKETARLILEPIGRCAVGAEGVVDLYLMPAYDDIASLFFCKGEWQLQFLFPERKTGRNRFEVEARPLSKELLNLILEAMVKNAK